MSTIKKIRCDAKHCENTDEDFTMFEICLDGYEDFHLCFCCLDKIYDERIHFINSYNQVVLKNESD